MFNNRQSDNSPFTNDFRDLGDEENLQTYHPRMLLTRQPRINLSDSKQEEDKNSAQLRISTEAGKGNKKTSSKPVSKWLPRMGSGTSKGFQQGSLRERLTQKMARLSSLDSTRSSSSVEGESGASEQQVSGQSKQVMPLISITSSPSETARRRQAQFTSDQYYGRPRISSTREYEDEREEDEEEEDEFGDDPSQVAPYLPTQTTTTQVIRRPSSIDERAYLRDQEDPLDDRQGMNDNDQQFTKGEKMARPSLDGSINSDLRLEGDAKRGVSRGRGGRSSRKDKQRRSKSPSSSSVGNLRRGRHSRRGFLGLASRLKLTRKHESIARLQLSILNSGFVSLKTMDRDLQSFLPKERLTPAEFKERVKLMRKYEVLAQIEYRFASRYEAYLCRHAIQETNQPKNNYKKCIPYDYNRVVLKTLPNVPDSDYINASHVDSCLKPNAYIAAQGPNENTIEDFWRMIWEQKTFVVVMLTKVFDFIRVMCNQYWPVELNKPERYGGLEVTLLYEEPLADFVIRTIKLTKLGSNQVNSAAQDDPKGEAATKTHITGEQAEFNSNNNVYEEDEDEEELTESEEEDDSSTAESEIENLGYSLPVDGSIPPVRAPKYRARRRKRRSTSENSGAIQTPDNFPFDLSPIPGGQESLPRSPAPASALTSSPSPQPVNLPPVESLHPLSAAFSNLAASSGANSPTTPRTPSSAGLDRSSATRKAVKKKRRERIRNGRPLRTQFQVPDERQLASDDAAENDELDKSGERVANERIIYQFHYNSWASHTCPFINSLLHFRRRVRICMDEMSKSGKTGPTVVHCNDGCGRTGTYLCIDANLELAEEDNLYDVFNYTKKMRQSRKFFIENLEQYRFVYDTIEEAMFCGKTWFPVSELHKRLKHKSQRNPITKQNEYQREYEKITRMTIKFSIGDCAGGHRVENREKNRDVSTVPPDNFRPYLNSFQSNDSTDYINAVFVDGYTRSKEYIVTEWPIHKTISDFWSLIYDHDCNSVILLANPGESSAYPSFLPSEKELRRKFGPVFSAEMVSYTHYQNIKSWIYTINKKIVSLTEVIAGVKSEAKTTQVFQITCWPQGHRVPTSTNALVELMNMVERWRQRTAYGPVCVVSLNGKSRAGVYCAANVAIEQVVQHSEVDVFQAVKTVRRHRPQLIENMTEYKYCYDLILHYVLHYVNQNTASV